MGRFRKPVCLYGYRGFESHPLRQFLSKKAEDDLRNLFGQKRRNRISDLNILLCSVSHEEVVIGKCLNPGCFSDRKAATLGRVIVNEIMAIF